jgi:hypothetical protein
MSILCSIKAISIISELFINYADTIVYLFSYVPFTMELLKQNIKHISHKLFSFYVGILYPTGEPISLQSLHCSPLAVVHYSFVGHCFAFAATSTRE